MKTALFLEKKTFRLRKSFEYFSVSYNAAVNQRRNKYNAVRKAHMETKKEISILSGERGKPGQMFSIVARESGKTKLLFTIISTMLDNASKLLQKYGLVIKKSCENDDYYIRCCKFKSKFFRQTC